jgi:hypothetical protein
MSIMEDNFASIAVFKGGKLITIHPSNYPIMGIYISISQADFS